MRRLYVLALIPACHGLAALARQEATWERSATDNRNRGLRVHCVTNPLSTAAYQTLLPFTGDGGTNLPAQLSVGVQSTTAGRRGGALSVPGLTTQGFLDALYPFLLTHNVTRGMVENVTAASSAVNVNSTDFTMWVRQPLPPAGSGLAAPATHPSNASYEGFLEDLRVFLEHDLPAAANTLGVTRLYSGVVTRAASPTATPTHAPTSPTKAPSKSPTASPTKSPTKSPTSPTKSPTVSPTQPTVSPTTSPPSVSPTTGTPSRSPTTGAPSATPSTSAPTSSPTSPTNSPATSAPTANPTTSPPTANPTTSAPSGAPTASPTTSPPSASPTGSPTVSPTSFAAGARRLLGFGTDVFGTGGPCCMTTVQADVSLSNVIAFRRGSTMASEVPTTRGFLGNPASTAYQQPLLADTDRGEYGYSDLRRVWIANVGNLSLPTFGFPDYAAAVAWANSTSGVTLAAQANLWNAPVVESNFTLLNAARTRRLVPVWIRGQLRHFADFGDAQATADVVVLVSNSTHTKMLLDSVQDLDIVTPKLSSLWYVHQYTTTGSVDAFGAIADIPSGTLLARPAHVMNCPVDEVVGGVPDAPVFPPAADLGPLYKIPTPAEVAPIFLPNEVQQFVQSDSDPGPLLYFVVVAMNRQDTLLYPASLGDQIEFLRGIVATVSPPLALENVKFQSLCWWNGIRGRSACNFTSATGSADLMQCNDHFMCNVRLEGWDCCRPHLGRQRCPSSHPMMCNEPFKCFGDHCCSNTSCAGLGGARACPTAGEPVLDEGQCSYCASRSCGSEAEQATAECRACQLGSCHGCVQYPHFGRGSAYVTTQGSADLLREQQDFHKVQTYNVALAQNGTVKLLVNTSLAGVVSTTPAPTFAAPKPIVLQLRLQSGPGQTFAGVNAAVQALRHAVREAATSGQGPMSSALSQVNPPLRILPGSDLYEEPYHLAPNEAGVIKAGRRTASGALLAAVLAAAVWLLA